MVRTRSSRSTAVVILASIVFLASAQSEPVDLYDLFGSGSWRLTSVTVAGEETPTDSVHDNSFAVNAEGRLAGSVGCNQMVVTGELEPDGSATFGPVTSTLMACPEPAMSLERALISALESVEAYSREAGTVILTGPSVVILFSAAAPGVDKSDDLASLIASTVSLDTFNGAVAEAARAGAAWTHEPLRVAMAFVDFNGGPETSIEMTLPAAEGAREATVRVEEHGLLDDSVEGASQTVELELRNDVWQVVSHQLTWFCRRGPDEEVVYPAVCP